MRKLTAVSAKLALFMVFGTALASAQSSGNFSTAVFSGTCTILGSGQFGGTGACQVSTDTPDCKVLEAPLKVSSANGLTLLITPSAVTGLLTDTKITTGNPQTSAQIGIQVCVQIDDGAVPVQGGDTNGCVVFDERFQQISTNLFNTVEECSTATEACNFDLLLSTLSAHSYNLIATQVPTGDHTITASWSVVGTANNGSNSSVAACVGPGNVTVTQAKIFTNSGGIILF